MTQGLDSRPSRGRFFSYPRQIVIDLVDNLGAATLFFGQAFLLIFRPKQFPEIVQQIYHIGARSSNIVLLIGLFTGMVLGLQLYYSLVKFGAEGILGSVVALSLIREMGPVLTRS